MHIHTLHRWKHDHRFHLDHGHGEQATWWVIVLTLVMMAAEILAGMLFGSMALLADGWHMGTHAVALGITVFAYRYARLHASNPRFSFGTGKVGSLGGFASAIVLAGVALLMIGESLQRFFSPVTIHFNEAIIVAVIGLVVNVVSAFILEGPHRHGHDQGHSGHHHHDQNLRAAYLHVLADALTSFLAIIALLAGKALGWVALDPLMGIVGAALILRWSYGLLRDTSRILLDSAMEKHRLEAMRMRIEADADNRVTDLHVWPLGAHGFAAIIAIVTHMPREPEYYKEMLLAEFSELDHITVEIHPCEGESCLASGAAEMLSSPFGEGLEKSKKNQ